MPPNEDGMLIPIHVGKALTDTDLHMQTDNEINGQPCDNISDKNMTHNELTAIYWAWKNLKQLYPDVKYVGLFHYRRFFAFSENRLFCEAIDKPEAEIANYKIDPARLEALISSYDVFMCKKIVRPYPQYVSFCVANIAGDEYRIMKEIIRNDFPDYYDAFVKFWEDNNKYSARNMFIMKYEDFEEYCSWLFSFLALLEDKMITLRTPLYLSRYFALLSERLLNVYIIRRHNMKAKYLNVYYYDEGHTSAEHNSILKRFCSFLKNFMIFFRNELIFTLISLKFKRLRSLFLRNKKSPKKL